MTKTMGLAELGADLAGIGQALEGGSFAEALRGPVRDQVAAGIEDNFNSQSGPEGQAWPPRKLIGDGHPLLIKSGALKAAAMGGGKGGTTEVTDRELTLTADLPYTGVHHRGSPKQNIPARPYMGVPERYLDAVDEAIADRALQLIEGA